MESSSLALFLFNPYYLYIRFAFAFLVLQLRPLVELPSPVQRSRCTVPLTKKRAMSATPGLYG